MMVLQRIFADESGQPFQRGIKAFMQLQPDVNMENG